MKLKADLSSNEMALQLKLDRKRVHLSELLEQKKDLEQVSQELYGELQNALLLTTRLETDNSALQDLIDEYRAGDACVPVLHEKLAMEQERSMKLKEQVIALKGDVSSLRHGYEELESELERRERGYVELQEDYAGLSYEFQKLTNRSELLTKDNLSLESQGRALRGQVMQLNETIVEIKGSLLVYCRVRPLFVEEMRALNLREEDVLALIQYPDYNLLDYNGIPYEFHRVFEPTADQGEVFAEVEAHVRSVVNGTRLCLFM
jgi:chromosome segregation ATPase